MTRSNYVRRSVLLLGLGLALSALSGTRWGVPALAWLAPIPYLLYGQQARGLRSWLGLLGVLLLGAGLQVFTIVTPPVPLLALIGFAAPLALKWFGALAVTELVRRRLGPGSAVLTFGAATALLDYVAYDWTELGTWMAAANAQVAWLQLMQLASLVGMAGLGFIMAWLAAAAASLLAPETRPLAAGHLAVAGGLLLTGLVWASVRLDTPVVGRSVVVGSVVTDFGPERGKLPGAEALAEQAELLFERTRQAAARGARLVVWNEAAAFVDPEHEQALVERGRTLARELHIDLVLAYAVLERRAPLLLDNKYLFIGDSGAVLDRYRKHHPVPGEPSLRGSEPVRVLQRPYGRVGGAICYDYDFPALARAHARQGAELVVVPASDWRGIDPIHGLMARTRAIEGGFALVRPTRWATSGAFDAHGRVRGWMPPSDDERYVAVTTVPVGRTPTLYREIGDAVVLLTAMLLLAQAAELLFALSRRDRASSSPPQLAYRS